MRRDVGRLPFGTFKHSKKIGVTVLVDVEGGKDLIPVTLWDAHNMTIFEIATKCAERVGKAKKGKDERHNKSTALADYIPSFIAQPISFIATYIASTVGISIPPLNLRNDTFGHVVLSNVGTLGYNSAFAPLCPLVHQMSLICTGKIEKRVIVETKDGVDTMKVASMMTAVGTGDHRYGDAAVFTPFFKVIRDYIEDPANFDHKDHKDVIHYTEAA